ncbi:MAG: GNAT family N-acetyltransferase [Chloroflexi bacterium]|nr:GNAT family N-acetyltransferase [Chloroflexota bacterium]MBP7042482.1 GNAT family N-acetyltransferase [Chloroflexota bacterium]
MTSYRIEPNEGADAQDKEVIHAGLRAYNTAHFGYADGRPLNLFIRDAAERIVGGLLGYTYWDYLAVDIFWLHEDLRGQGYGTQLLQMAEQEAIARGCHQAHLDTFEFQAPGFYEKHGYQCWGVLDGYGGRFKRLYYRKQLAPPDAE